jgi:hypothetical protein
MNGLPNWILFVKLHPLKKTIIMKKIFLFFLIIVGLLQAEAQETETLYLSGKDKDHTVQWDFFCANGRNSGHME